MDIADEKSRIELSRAQTQSIESSKDWLSLANELVSNDQELLRMPQRTAILMGKYTEWLTMRRENIPELLNGKDRSMFSQERFKFMLEAPFEVSHLCCNVMKKAPIKAFAHSTHRVPITAQMAAESRLRTQKWLQNGCNAFDAKEPISNPMSFWTEQDVLQYIRLYDIPIAPVYGKVVTDDEESGQMSLNDIADLGLFDLGNPTLHTTGCNRTGCCMCGFGCHLDKRPNRFELIEQVSNPKILDYMLRGGAFCEDGLWRPNKGLGYWFVLKWINIHGGFNIYIPNYEHYEKKYGNELTHEYLYGG